jgi:hypothetical protein
MRRDKDHFELSSGKRFYAHAGLLSVRAADASLFYGYDGYVEYVPEGEKPGEGDLTPEERAEIAEYMMELWREWGGLK